MTNQHKETKKAIKNLVQNAKKGNLLSMFQLYENYSSGKHVEEENESLANHYLSELSLNLVNVKFQLNSLNLHEFRRFRSLDIKFDKKITVIIGDNGAGKTSIAEAIAKTLTWFNNNLKQGGVSGSSLSPADIHADSCEYAEVLSTFQFGGNNTFDVTLGGVVPGYTANSPTNMTEIRKLSDIYRHTAKNPSIMIPLLAFYSVERSDFKLKQRVSEKASSNSIRNRFSALDYALKGTGKLDDFSGLYIELVNLAEGESTKEVKKLKEQISTFQNIIDDVYEGKEPPKNNPFLGKLNSKKEELRHLLSSMSSVKYQRHLDFVNHAIETLVPDVKNLELDRSTGKPRILVENFGNKVNISQLSQGQKMLVALTGDLARRLVTLNPESANPLHGHGIVVIDEIELHLHPKWQQEILIGLQATFPNLQFIVTTHSPQVLSTVDSHCIRQICIDESGQPTINTPTFQTKGVTSADILARIMGTNSVPEKLEEAAWLNDFSRYLKVNDQKLLDSIFSKIKKHFGEHHPVVVDCESQIRIALMKARLNKEQ